VAANPASASTPARNPRRRPQAATMRSNTLVPPVRLRRCLPGRFHQCRQTGTNGGHAAGPADLIRGANGLDSLATLATPGTAPSYAVPGGAAIGWKLEGTKYRPEGVGMGRRAEGVGTARGVRALCTPAGPAAPARSPCAMSRCSPTYAQHRTVPPGGAAAGAPPTRGAP
jgi:hypothetical protein